MRDSRSGYVELGKQEGTPYTLLEFLTNLLKDRLWLSLAFLVPMVAAGFLAWRSEPSYEAKASLVVRLGREHIYQPEVGELGTQPIAMAREQALRSELNILTSRDLLEKVVRKFGPHRLVPALAKRPPAARQPPADSALLQVEERLNAVLLKDSSVIEVTFRHSNPQLAAEVVNQLIGEYLKKRVDVLSERRASFMDGEVVSSRQRLVDLEKRIDDFKREHEIVSYERQRELLLDQRTTIESRLGEVNARLAEVKGRLEVIQPPAAGEVGTEPVRDEGFRPGAVRDLVATEGVKLQADQRSAEATKRVLQQQLGEISGRLRRFTQNESQLQQMLREKQLLETGFQSNSKRLEDARILEDLDKRAKNSVSIVQAATPPLKKKRTRILILGVGGAVSVLSMLFVGFLCDLFRNVYLVPDQLRRSVGLPVLVSFPRAKRS